MTSRTRRVRSGDVELAVSEWGQPDDAPILLVHGYPNSRELWRPIAEQLAPHHHVIAYDVRGAGESSAPTGDDAYTLDRLVTDCTAVIDATAGGRRVHLVGHDWGSVQSWEAVTAVDAPQRIASFTSVSGPCLDHLGHWMRAAPRSQVARQMLRSWYVGVFQLPLVQRAALAVARSPRSRDVARGMSLYRANVRARLARPRERSTSLPVQLVIATRDPYVDRALFDGLERWAPALVRREVDAGHWDVLEDAARFARWMEEWIGLTRVTL